jgi:putative glutamine amidotransferase
MAPDTDKHSQRPVIGVTGNDRSFSPSWICLRLAVWMAGGKAERISVSREYPVDRVDGLIIGGGDDIHPSLFEAEPSLDKFYDRGRDALEQRYILAAHERHLPMLGICRGHQLINVTFGGTLHTDIRHMRRLTYNRRGLLPTKTVRVSKNSTLARVTGEKPFRINSLHYQAVGQAAPGFRKVAEDLDGLCQAIEHDEGNIIGVQWHPEYMFYLREQQRIFRWLVRFAA